MGRKKFVSLLFFRTFFLMKEQLGFVCTYLKHCILFFRLGLIEWIENTMTLKDLLLNNMSKEEKVAYSR